MGRMLSALQCGLDESTEKEGIEMASLVLDEIILKSGSHSSPRDGMCALEAAAYIAGEAHSDHPKCVSDRLVVGE